MAVAIFLASPAGRVLRVAGGAIMAAAAVPLALWLGLGDVGAFLLLMLGAEIAVGGALNVCILCPLRGLPFEGRRLAR